MALKHPLSFYKDAVLPIIREAGEILLPHYGKADGSEYKTEIACDVVTVLDREIEIFLAKRLKEIDPEIEFHGEEFGGSKEGDKFWICDPIDGTAHFVRGMPFCTTMLALIVEGQVVFSCIYDFVNKNMYVAVKGEGATKNGEKISVSDRSLSQAYLGHEIDIEKGKNSDIRKEIHDKAILFNVVASGFDLCMTAEGKTEGKILLDPWGGDYDYAPGSLLVSEAGGIVRNIGSDSYDFRNHNFLAVNKVVYPELVEIIKKFRSN